MRRFLRCVDNLFTNMQLYFIKYENSNINKMIHMVCVSLLVRDINAVLILNQSDDIVEVRFGPSEFWLVVKNGVSESMIRVGTKKCRLGW